MKISRLIKGRCLKQEGSHFKVRGVAHLKLLDVFIVSFQITLNSYHYYIIALHIPELLIIFISSLFVYLFRLF